MERLPVVSIVIPVYNAEHYLHKMLDGAVRQTFKDYELILVDDGSTDGSLAVCEDYQQKDARIRVIHQENAGASAARNRGIAECLGEYLTFWDADDEIEPDMLMAMVNNAQENKSDLVVCGVYTDIVEDSKVVSSSKMSEPDQVIMGNSAIREYVVTTMHSSIIYPVWNKLYRSSLIKKYGLQMRKDIEIGEDLIFNLNYIQHIESFSVLSQCFYHYYQYDTGNNLMAQFREDKAEIMEIWVKELFSFSQDLSDPYIKEIVLWMKTRWFLSCFIEMVASNKKFNEKCIYIKTVIEREHLQDIRVSSLNFFNKAIIKCVTSGNVFLIYILSLAIGVYKQKCKIRYYKKITKSR